MRAALLAVVACAGCASYRSMTSARPVAPGASAVTTALDGGKLSILPLGDALTSIGAEAQARWRFAGDETRRWELSLAPSAGWRGTESS